MTTKPVKKKRLPRSVRGEQCSYAKLSEAEVIVIRQELDAGTASIGWLAREYGVSAGCIQKIKERTTWTHLDDEERS